MPTGLRPSAGLPVFSSGLAAAAPENVIGVFAVIRRLSLDGISCQLPRLFWRTSSTEAPCAACDLRTISSV